MFILSIVLLRTAAQQSDTPFQFPWAIGEEWFFTQGTHDWGAGSRSASGLDFAPRRGSSQSERQIRPVAAGMVVEVNRTNTNARDGCGLYVDVEHEGGWRTSYCHISNIPDDITPGRTVSVNDIIGIANNTGRSTGTHLHLELIRNGEHVSWNGIQIGGWTVNGDQLERQGRNPIIARSPAGRDQGVTNEGEITNNTGACLLVNVTSANLRGGPGTNYPVVGSARHRDNFPIVARTGSGQNTWYLITRANGQRAWIWSGIVVLCPFIGEIEEAATVPAPPTVIQPEQPVSSDTTETVQANVQWHTTTVQVAAGQTIIIEASGTWSHGVEGVCCGPNPYDANGYHDKFDASAFLPDQRVGALIGRIGRRRPFFIGTRLEFVSSVSGILELSMNDIPGGFSDNSGSLQVHIRAF